MLDADVQLRRKVGLRTRLRQALLDVLGAVMERRKVSGGEVGKDSGCVTAWSAEPVRDARGAA